MCKTKLKWVLCVIVFLLSIVTSLFFCQALDHALLFLPSQLKATFFIPGITYIVFAGVILISVACYFSSNRAKTTLRTAFYSILLTYANMVMICAWLFTIEENVHLFEGSSSEYFEAFTVSGAVSIVCSLLLIIVYNIMRAICHKKVK